MDVLAIKKYAREQTSQMASIQCLVYQKSGYFWYCPDPYNKEDCLRLERELEEGKWSGRVSRWITSEEYLLWNLSLK